MAAVTSANADKTSAEVITFVSSGWTGGQTITLTSPLTLSNTSESITIDGTFGSSGTITVSGGNASSIFQINAKVTATLENLTITGASSNSDGAGIFNQGTLAINSCTVSNNTVNGNGGALYNERGTVTMNNCTIIGNTAIGGGNTAGCGAFVQQDDGGSSPYNVSKLTVTNCTISNNNAAQGSAFNFSGTVTISGTTISNTATTGGQAILDGGGTLLVENKSSISGYVSGVIYATQFQGTNPTVTIDNSTISGNKGGAIYADAGTALIVQNNSLIQNNSGSNGGGIYFAGATLTIQGGAGRVDDQRQYRQRQRRRHRHRQRHGHDDRQHGLRQHRNRHFERRRR